MVLRGVSPPFPPRRGFCNSIRHPNAASSTPPTPCPPTSGSLARRALLLQLASPAGCQDSRDAAPMAPMPNHFEDTPNCEAIALADYRRPHKRGRCQLSRGASHLGGAGCGMMEMGMVLRRWSRGKAGTLSGYLAHKKTSPPLGPP